MLRIVAAMIALLTALPAVSSSLQTKSYHLSNGLKIIVREDHRSPVVLSSIWYKVGGSYESNGYTGISHLLEHMMFQGTKKYGPGKLNQLISAHGGVQNAMTGEDFTAYYQELPANQLALSFELESDRMHNLQLTQKAFQKEKKVVMEERRMRVDNNPRGRLWEHFAALAFVNNPYHHPIIGWMTDLKNLTLSDLKKWYRRWYAPNNAVLIVVGDVKTTRVLQLAKKYFEPIKPAIIKKLKPRKEIKPLGKKQLNMRIPAKLRLLLMGYLVPTLPSIVNSNKADIYALKLAEMILSGGEAAKLQKNIIRKKQVAVFTSASYSPFDLHNSLFILSGIPSSKFTLSQLEENIVKQINQLKTHLVSNKTLDRAKTQVLAQETYEKDSLMNMAIQMGSAESVGLSWQDADTFANQVNKVTASQIKHVMQKYFKNRRLSVAVLTPNQFNKGAR